MNCTLFPCSIACRIWRSRFNKHPPDDTMKIFLDKLHIIGRKKQFWIYNMKIIEEKCLTSWMNRIVNVIVILMWYVWCGVVWCGVVVHEMKRSDMIWLNRLSHINKIYCNTVINKLWLQEEEISEEIYIQNYDQRD